MAAEDNLSEKGYLKVHLLGISKINYILTYFCTKKNYIFGLNLNLQPTAAPLSLR